MRFLLAAILVLSGLPSVAAARAVDAAPVEFCTATASVPFPIGSAFGAPARTFGYDLTALSSRSVTATLIADTTAGWYSWTVNNVSLPSTKRAPHFSTIPRSFRLMPYNIAASPTLAVTFPAPLSIRHMWVTWSGGLPCAVPAFDGPSDTVAPDPADVSTNPSPSYPVATPTLAASPFTSFGCDQPFVSGTVIKAEVPDYPISLRLADAGPLAVAVQVALDPAGNLIAAWVRASSGFPLADRAALEAAVKSKYQGAISYCQPANSMTLFFATFMPEG